MTPEETLRQVVEVGDRGSNVLTYEILAAIRAVLEENEELKQTSGEMCEKCGWRSGFPECVRCENERLRNKLNTDSQNFEIEGLRERIRLTEARIEATLALHVSDGQVAPRCTNCRHEWPCPTVKALQGGSEDNRGGEAQLGYHIK